MFFFLYFCGFNAPAFAQEIFENTDPESDFKKVDLFSTLSFSYPKSWRGHTSQPYGSDDFHILQVSPESTDTKIEKVVAQITVYGPVKHENEIPYQDISQIFKRWLFSNRNGQLVWNVEFSDLIEEEIPGLQTLKIDPKVKMLSGSLYELPNDVSYYYGSAEQGPFALGYCVLTLDHYSILITLVTQSKKTKPKIWEESIRVYKELLESFQFYEPECSWCHKLNKYEITE